MSLGKWLSLCVGLAVTLLVAAFQTAPGSPHLLGGLEYGWRHGELTSVLMSAAGLGVAVGLLHWLIVSRFDTDLLKVVGYIESLGRSAWSTGGSYGLKHDRLSVNRDLAPIADAAVRSVSALRDRNEQLINQRRELEVQLRIADTERRHAEAILNSISDAVIVTDAFNEVVLVNESAARAFGFERKEVMGLRKPIEQALQDATLVKLIKDTREGGEASLRRHVEHAVTRNGKTVIYDVSLSTITNRDTDDEDAEATDHPNTRPFSAPATCAGVVTILRDVTYEREVSEMKTEFVSNVSHELRTPLSSIKAYVEMLVDGEAQDEQTRGEFYNIIQGETNRLQRLIDNILNISRIESGVVKVQREYISLPQVVSEVIDVMRPQARSKQIDLVILSESGSASQGGLLPIFADRDMIYQAVLNLVGNAVKYTPAGGDGKIEVAITTDERRRTATLSVTDNGVGIPKADLPHLFEKFYRVQDHKKVAKGTGLGLNLVKQIIETVHGGRVFVRSRTDGASGSTFGFSLPLAEHAA